MTWDDTGFLLSKYRYNENSLIAEVYTRNHGKISGIIFGGTSKKIKNYLQIGNKIHISFSSKSESKLGYFKIEIYKALSPIYFDNHQKLSCIISVMKMVKLLSAESQVNTNIYQLLENFYLLLDDQNWIKEYIFWELELLKHFGYDLDLNKIVSKDEFKDKSIYSVKRNNTIKYVPSFLVENKKENIEYKELLKGLRLVDDYMIKSIFNPNNIDYPLARLDFLNIIKN